MWCAVKILLVGKRQKYNAEFFYERAFRQLGHDVNLVDSYSDVRHPFFSRYLHTRTSVFDFTLGGYWINIHLPKIVESYDPDAVIIFKGEFVSAHTVEKISHNHSTYLLYPDTFKFKPLLRRFISSYRKIFTSANNKEFYYRLGARNVITVPWAFDPDFHRPLDIDRRYDVSFIGTAYPERRRIIRNLHAVEVFGDFWYGFGRHSHPPVFGEEFVKTINQSKINLNLQAKVSVLADSPTMRTFEVAGCGGFQISDYMPSLKRYFPSIVSFRDSRELKELIRYYLDSYDEAKEVAIKTMETCRSNYKYTDAARKILNSM